MTDRYSNPRYFDSGRSTPISMGELPVPVLTLNNTLITYPNPNNVNITGIEVQYDVDDSGWLPYPGTVVFPANIPILTDNGNYKYQARFVAYNSNNEKKTSDWSDPVTFEIRLMITPTITSDTGTSHYYFSNIDPDTEFIIIRYKTLTNEIISPLPSSTTEWPVLFNDPGIYNIQIRVESTSPTFCKTSDWSNTELYTVGRLNTPLLEIEDRDPDVYIRWGYYTTTSISITANEQQWNEGVPFANSYSIYNSTTTEPIITTTATDYTFVNSNTGMDGITVVANYITSEAYPNPHYISSYPSNSERFGVLETPSITATAATTITITNFSDYSDDVSFEVYNNDELIATIDSENFYLNNVTEPTTYNIRMKATAGGITVDSGFSDYVPISFSKIATPQLTMEYIDANSVRLTWEDVNLATLYTVYQNDRAITLVETNTYDATLETGGNSFQVSGSSEILTVISSDKSNTVYANKDDDREYYIEVNNEHYVIALPFNFVTALDEALDIMSISTIPIDLKKPFEAYTPVTIYANRPAGNGQYQPMVNFPMYMLVSEDKVEEIMLGENSKFKHHLTLIERTRFLQTELMPDFSISQPLEFVEAINSPVGIAPDSNSYKVFLNAEGNSRKMSHQVLTARSHGSFSDYVFISGLNSQGIIHRNNLPKTIQLNKEIELPYEPATSFNIGLARCTSENVAKLYNFIYTFVYEHRVEWIDLGEGALAVWIAQKAALLLHTIVTTIGIALSIADIVAGINLCIQGIIHSTVVTFDYGTDQLPDFIVPSPNTGIRNHVAHTTFEVNSLTDLNIKLRKTYKIREARSEYEDMGDETVITRTYDGAPVKWTFNNYDTSKEYDLIYEVDILPADMITLKNYFNDFISNEGLDITPINKQNALDRFNIQFMIPGGIDSKRLRLIYTRNDYYPLENHFWSIEYSPKNIEFQYSNYYNDNKKYRLVWRNIRFNTPAPEAKAPSKSIYYALQKALDIVQPRFVDAESGQIDAPKYTLDPKLRYLDGGYYANGNRDENDQSNYKINYYPIPEMSFCNQKSLWEVLLEIGRLFYGIPRLGCYDENNVYQPNMITFDIMDSKTLADLEEAYDANTLENIQSSIDNHATGYTSLLENITDTDLLLIYPPQDLWITARNEAYNEPITTHDNMKICVDKPIYKIHALLVKNFNTSSEDRFIDISNYVYEDTVYQALNNNIDGKGKALHYKMGSNEIQGLGLIPEAPFWYAAFDMDYPYYTIQEIIEDADKDNGGTRKPHDNELPYPGRQMNTVDNFQYKVIYVPYTDGRIYTEQSNISGLRNHNYKALNQENPVISDKTFAQSAQTLIERLGNNSITKTYRNSSNENVPHLGDIKEFDGEYYYADTINYQYNNNYRDTEVSFSKNFNKINERIGIDAAYRMYRIINDKLVSRSINTNMYCYLSTNAYAIPGTISSDFINAIRKSFYDTTGGGAPKSKPEYRPDTLYIRPYQGVSNYYSSKLKYTNYDGEETDVPASVLAVNYNRFGNSIAFTASMRDNYSAGVKAVEEYKPKETLLQQLGRLLWIEPPRQFKNQDVRYVNNDGECPYIATTLMRLNLSNRILLGLNERNYPEATFLFRSVGRDLAGALSGVMHSAKYYVNKDSREALKFIYQLHYQTYDKHMRIHTGITRRNFITYDTAKNEYGSATDAKQLNPPIYILYKGSLSRVNNIRNLSEFVEVGTPSWVNTVNRRIHISGMSITPTTDYDGYAMIWPDNGEIIFSYRQHIPEGTQFTIPDMYMNFSDKMISYQEN